MVSLMSGPSIVSKMRGFEVGEEGRVRGGCEGQVVGWVIIGGLDNVVWLMLN
jgi:hypothetical protein